MSVFEAARILQNDPDIKFMFSGEGVGWAKLKAMQATAPLPNVILIERVLESNLESFLSAGDIWIVPYRSNNTGVYLEASRLSSVAGDMGVTGFGAGTGTMNGVFITAGTTLISTSGDICVNGTTPDDTNVAIALQTGANSISTAGQIALIANNGGINLGLAAGGDSANITSTYSVAGNAAVSLISDNGVNQYTGTVSATGGLLLQGEGAFFLESAGNQLSSLAASITNDTVTPASLILRAQNGFQITSLTACVDCTALTVSGVTVGVPSGTMPPVVPTANYVVFNVAAGNVTQNQALSTSNLLLLGGANYQLLSNVNNADVITANLTGTGSVAFRDADSITVGSFTTLGIQPVVPAVYTATGITTANQNAAVQAVGSIYIDQAVNVGTANAGFQAGTLIRQNATGGITANGLQLSGGAAVNLVAATNNVATLSARTVGALNYIDQNSFAVGSVATQLNGGTAIAGIGSTGDVYLTSSATGGATDVIALNSAMTSAGLTAIDAGVGSITIAASVDAGTNLYLKAGKAITQAGGSVTAGSDGGTLVLVGGAGVDMQGAGNKVGTIVAGTVGLPMDGICYVDSTALTVGEFTTAQFLSGAAVAEPFGGTYTAAGTITGVNSSKQVSLVSTGLTVNYGITAGAGGSDIILKTGAGNLTLAANLQATGGDIGLWSSGTVNQTAGSLTAIGLQLLDGNGVATTAGTFSLNSATNKVSKLSGAANSVSLFNNGALDIAPVDTSCCTLSASSAGLTVAGTASLGVNGALGGGFVKANTLIIEAGGNVNLTDAANDVTTLAISQISGTSIRYTDANAVNVGSGTGVSGGAVVGITGQGSILLGGTDVTQSSKIIAPNGLAVTGGNATIGNAGNNIASYAANNTGNVSITSSALSPNIVIGTVEGVSGIKAAKLTLAAGAGNITQTAAVVAPVLVTTGTGNVTLTNAGNDFTTASVSNTGAVDLTDANSIIVNDVNASIIGVKAGGDVTINSPSTVNMGVISGNNVNITAQNDIRDANGKANNITASVQTTLIAKTGTITTTPTPELAPAYQGINTPTLSAFAGGITTTNLGSNISIDVWGQVGNDTILLIGNPPGEVYLNGRLIGQQPTGVITAAMQTWQNSTGDITMMPPLTPADYYSTDDFTTGSVREFFENAPAAGINLDATNVHVNNGGINLPSGVPALQTAGSMILAPGGAPMNLPNGAVVAMAANGDVIITLPTGGLSGVAGSGALASSGGLSAVTITPAGIVTGRDGNGLPMGVEGGIAGNQELRGLLDQIADFLPEEYRKRWGLRAKAAAAEGSLKVSQL